LASIVCYHFTFYLNTTSNFEERLQGIDNEVQKKISSHRAKMADKDVAEREKVQEETDSIKQSLGACAEASHEVNQPRINIFEGISAAEDADQVFVSTTNALFSVKQAHAGAGARQWGGQMNDVSLQQLSLSRRTTSADRQTTDRAVESETEQAVNFDQYGAGHTLEGRRA
jgi:hypothetical protein